MYRTYIKNLHPFFKPDGDDDVTDINSLLFGDSPRSDDDLFEVPDIEGIDAMVGDDLDAALAALLAEDGASDDSTITGPVAPAPEPAADSPSPLPAADDTLLEPETVDILTGAPAATPPAADPAPAAMPPAADPPLESADGADIDALLAALGGGDDTESISGTAPEPVVAAPAPAAVAAPAADPAPALPPAGEDDMLSRMLAIDEQASSGFELKDVAPTVIETEDEWSEFAYDPNAEPQAVPAAADKAAAAAFAARGGRAGSRRVYRKGLRGRLAEISTPRFMAVSVLILLVILGSGALALNNIRSVYGARIDDALVFAQYIRVRQPENVANYSHFVALSELLTVGEQEFFLRRMSFGQRGTFFHFGDIFDPDDFIFVLVDQENRLYKRSAVDFEYDLALYPGRRMTVLQFAALQADVSSLTLYIQGHGGGPVGSFNFILDEGPNFPAAMYVNRPIPLIAEAADRFVVDNAVFSNTGSEIVYLKRYDPVHGSIAFGERGLSLREGTRNPVAKRPEPAEYSFPELGMVLGRIAYGPVRNLGSGSNLVFRDLFVSYPMPASFIDIAALFRDSPQDEQVITLGSHTLRLERMGVQGPFVILVFYGHDEEYQRIHTELIANLIIETEAGPVVIEGRNFHSESYVGTDLFFDTRPYAVDLIRMSDMRLDISAVQIRVEESNIAFFAAEHDMTAAPQRVAVEQAIANAFASRLAYRSGELAFGDISGFSQDVINNHAVMRHYSPINLPPGTHSRVMYDVSVVAGAFAYADLFLAVVEEEWVSEVEGSFSLLRNTHQVVARYSNGSWSVVSNRIV